MSKASWLPAHVYGNGYVGIGGKGICSWVIAETREILLLYTILFAHVPPLFLSRLTAYYMFLLSIIKTENVKMNQNEEVPDNLGGLGDLLPADVLKMVNFFNEPDEQSGSCSDSAMARKSRMKFNELLEQLHRKEKDHQGGIVLNIYEKGSLHVDHVDNQNFYGDACPKAKTLPDPPCVGREKGNIDAPTLPPLLRTDKAMVLWQKAQDAGYVDTNYQPLISRTQAALLADAIAERLGIKEKWKVFEGLWNRKNMYRDYYKALNLQQSLAFQDEIKKLFR